MIFKIYRYLVIFFLTSVLVVTASMAIAENKIANNPNNYLQQGKELYDRGNLNNAITIWQQALQQYQSQQDLRSQAIAYNYLSIGYQDLGQWDNAEAAINKAKKIINTIEDDFLYAQILNTQGNLDARTNRLEDAISIWQNAANIYRQLNTIEPLLRVQLNQALALNHLGYGTRSLSILEQTNTELSKLPNSQLKIIALQSLGNALRSTGELEKSQAILQRSLQIAEELRIPADIVAIKLSLADTLQVKQDFNVARNIYQEIITSNSNKIDTISAKISLINLLVKTENNTDIDRLLKPLEIDLASLPNSNQKINFQINLASSLNRIGKRNLPKNLLQNAIAESENTKNTKLEAYAIAELGHYYEQNNRLDLAATTTQKAIILANKTGNENLLANLYWQQGRILTAKGQKNRAITAYQQAVTNLQQLRQDIIATTPEIQFSFRDRIEPIYRQYVELLLKDVDTLPRKNKQQNLVAARNAIESLQLAELENFFREACIASKPQPIEKIDPNAAVIYPISLENSLDVIVSLPGNPLQHYGQNFSTSDRDRLIQNLNYALIPSALKTDILAPAGELYNLLISPVANSLEKEKVETIVFVLDDWLRSLPMSILHDGKSYLIEKYNVALTPGLQLLSTSKLEIEKLNTIVGAIGEARQGFSQLPNIKKEVKQIDDLLPTNSLINESFTRSKFQEKVTSSNFSVVHLATHGQFSSQAKDTFLLTWDDKLNIKDLSQLLQNRETNKKPIELLVLSACTTATGDDRAGLGMAGIAVRSGARSTMATLWNVSDRSTADFMGQFYQFLSQGKTKAEALRLAQQSLINNSRYNHPYYWSPFVLIGNWQ